MLRALLFVAIALFGLSHSAILRLSSPFLPCGTDPVTRQTQCLVLDPSVYSTLSSLPVGSQVEFSSFPLSQPGRTAFLSLTRFSADTEQRDLPLVVLLRGSAFEDESSRAKAMSPFELKRDSTVVLGLTPHGSNGYAELGNLTFFLSTPLPSLEAAEPEMDAFVAALAIAARKALGPAPLSFNHGRASIISEKSSLHGSVPLPTMDYVLPPKEVLETASRMMAENEGKPFIRRTYTLASDADYQLYQVKGYNADAVGSYYYTMVGHSGSIFGRDFGSDMVSNYLKVYVQQDPYPSSSGAALEYMQRNWGSSPARSFAALVSAKNLGGGVAYFRTLCNTAWAYAVSGNLVGYYPNPLQNYHGQNWDIFVFMHEAGHVWGASHTHDLNPPPDRCGTTPGCGPTQGSIMSYCHGCQNGMSNIYLSFHAASINEVRPFIGGVAC